MKEVVIVNRLYPPAIGVTGESAAELSEFLIDHNTRVTVITTDGQYDGGGALIDGPGKKLKVKGLYSGKRKLFRLFSSCLEGFLLILKARRVGKGSLVIVMTDPPFLAFWASLLLKDRQWALWTMDLYPDAFVAAKLIGRNGWVHRFFKWNLLRNYPSWAICLGGYQKTYLEMEYDRRISSVILPCGITRKKNGPVGTPDWAEDGRMILGYCGNLGEAHSASFVSAVIDSFDREKFVMILCVYGAKAKDVRCQAATKEGVTVVDRVDRVHLSFIDVHLVTLLPDWNNICVPSKAVSAVCEGGSLLFCGNKENDTWGYLADAAWLVEDGPEMKEQVSSRLDDITKESLAGKKASALQIASQMDGFKRKAFYDILEISQGPFSEAPVTDMAASA